MQVRGSMGIAAPDTSDVVLEIQLRSLAFKASVLLSVLSPQPYPITSFLAQSV